MSVYFVASVDPICVQWVLVSNDNDGEISLLRLSMMRSDIWGRQATTALGTTSTIFGLPLGN